MPHTTDHNTASFPPDVRSRLQRQYVAEAGVFLSVVMLDPLVRRDLGAHGYSSDEIARGLALAKTAGETVVKHPEGLGVRDEADDHVFAAAERARDEFIGFHQIARAAFPQHADREGLGVAADVPEDFEGLLAAARHAYQQASQPPYAEKMTLRGHNPTHLTKLLVELETLCDGPAENNGTDAAQRELAEFMREIKGVARGVLRNSPSLLSKLQLVKEKVKPELRVDVGVDPQQDKVRPAGEVGMGISAPQEVK